MTTTSLHWHTDMTKAPRGENSILKHPTDAVAQRAIEGRTIEDRRPSNQPRIFRGN